MQNLATTRTKRLTKLFLSLGLLMSSSLASVLFLILLGPRTNYNYENTSVVGIPIARADAPSSCSGTTGGDTTDSSGTCGNGDTAATN